VNRVGVNRARIAYRSGLGGVNRVGWNGNWNYGNRARWGVAAAGLAIGATAAAYNPGSYYDSEYYLTRDDYIRSYRGTGYIGPVCNPWVDRLCQ
jgi:hypothetical protein